MNRIKEFDFIRGISIIAVIMIHIGSGSIMVNSTSQTLKVPISTFFVYHQLMGFAVSAFIVCSGIVLVMRYKEREFNYLEFIGKRSIILLVPYFIWSLIYLWYNSRLFIDNGIMAKGGILKISAAEILYALASGNSNAHMYYIPLLFSLYWLFPVFRFIVQKIKSPWWLVLVLLLQHYFQIRLQTAVPKDILVFFQFRFFLFLFLTGCYVGQYYDEVRAFIDKYINAIIGLLGTVFLFKVCVFYYTAQVLKRTITDIPQTVTFENKIYTLLIIAIIIYVAPYIKNKYAELTLVRLGACSFGIYLAHPIFLKIIYKLMREYNIDSFVSEGALVVLGGVVLVSYLLTEGLNKLPSGYLFIGRNDRARSLKMREHSLL